MIGRFVSTHSRPKAAASQFATLKARLTGFNTQPPEGGCNQDVNTICNYLWFQHTAARRRLLVFCDSCCHIERVSTHSRPKAAARIARFYISIYSVSTHSRPKAAALPYLPYILTASFNTQPPEGGC